MDSRELIKDTIEFNNPQRIPRDLWTLPWAENKYPETIKKINEQYPPDIVRCPGYYRQELPTEGYRYKKGEFIDEWGCRFVNLHEGIHGEVKNPILDEWDKLNQIHIPEERLTINKEKINRFCNNTTKFVIPEALQRPFERMQFIRGTDKLMIDLMDRPAGFKELIDIIHEFYKEEVKMWCETNIDAIFLMDDWGAQDSLLINPLIWEDIFKPLYKEYIDIAHENNKYVFMHSDGHIESIIPGLIDLGVDAINSQLFCMDIEKIGREFAGKITFWGEVDRQHLLPEGTRKEIAGAVKKVFNNLFKNGGAIAQCEFGPGARPENVLQVFETWDSLK